MHKHPRTLQYSTHSIKATTTTPSYPSGEPNPFFNFNEDHFTDIHLPETEGNQLGSWGDQLNFSALELQRKKEIS